MDLTNQSDIRIQAAYCLDCFKRICQRLQSAERLEDEDHCLELPEESLTDAMDRFKIWAGNIGALQSGRASLDYRLGHSDVRMEVLRLLKQLLGSLTELWDIVSGARAQQVWSSLDVFGAFSDGGFSDNAESERLTENELESCVESPSIRSYQSSTLIRESTALYDSILESITSLFKLSMFIRKSARGNKFLRSSKEEKYETQFDISHVRDKFPHGARHERLMEHLGKANARRRQWLLYRKRHREKLAGQVNSRDDELVKEETRSSTTKLVSPAHAQDLIDHQSVSFPTLGRQDSMTVLSSTVASSFHGLSVETQGIEDHSDAGFSETSYTASQFGGDEQNILQVPRPPPESVDQSPFECPYCYEIISITGNRSWTKHVHSDLASYTCTFVNCNQALFESRHQWFNHELEMHRHRWLCTCHQSFETSEKFVEHMRQEHAGTFINNQLPALMARAEIPVRLISASACPLCDYESALRQGLPGQGTDSRDAKPIMVNVQNFRSHLGRHLEQLALFVLPRNELEEQPDGNADLEPASDEEKVISENASETDAGTNSEHESDRYRHGQSSDVDAANPEPFEQERRQHAEHALRNAERATRDAERATRDAERIAREEARRRAYAEREAEREAERNRQMNREAKRNSGLERERLRLEMENRLRLESQERQRRRQNLEERARALKWEWPREGLMEEPAHDHANSKPLIEPQSKEDLLLSKVTSPGFLRIEAHQNRLSFDDETEVKTEDEIIESTGFPDLAMGWQPPMDFWPPEKDFEQEESDWIPRREEPMFGGDLFTPGWVRGYDSQKQGFCGRCQPGTWHNIEDSSYQLNLTYHHGIATSGVPLPRPSSIRESNGKAGVWEGYCDTCENWQILRRTSRGWNWFRHCIKVSGVDFVVSIVRDLNIAQELGLPGYQNIPEEREAGPTKGVDVIANDTSAPEGKNLSLPNMSPFLTAVTQGNHGVVVSLIDQGADVEEINWEGRTALMISASNGSLDVIRTLLRAGANVNATSKKGWTALMVTIKKADERTADLLLQNGADVNHLSPDRWTALAEATNQGQSALMEKLLDYGADPETKSSHDWTPLMHAAYRGDQVGVRLLLRAGAKVNGSSQRDETALLLAAAGGHTEIVRTLLEAGAAAEPSWVNLPLEKAGESHEADTAAEGTNVDGGGPEARSVALGWTPLMLACQTGNEETVGMLLDRGVSLEPKSPYGKKAMEIARENARMGVVELLRKQGRWNTRSGENK